MSILIYGATSIGKVMKNNLEILIDTLQQEVDYLESEMKACAEKLDFEAAELFRVSWVHTRQRWQILKNLENPNYDEIQYLEEQIRRYENLVSDEKGSASLDRIQRRYMQECKQKLDHLQGIKLPGFQDGDELIICIDKLKTGEIESFDLVLESVVLHLSNEGDNCQLDLRPVRDSRLLSVMHPIREAQLRQMGFELRYKSAYAFLGKASSISTTELLAFLSKITFEVFNLYGGKEAILRYEEQLNR